jgi:hypothetical protein
MALRVSPPKVFPSATRAPKPSADSAGSADAYRQSSFVLDAEIELVIAGLNAAGAAAEAASGAKTRTQLVASAMLPWSRAWLARLAALHQVQWGNYAAATPLVRAAADHQASMLLLLNTGAVEWQEWLDAGGISIAPGEHATQFRLHAFRAAEILAAHEILGPLYRVTMDLSLSHFGSSMLLAASDSAPDHVSPTFGDRDFHLGLAELHLGWLLELGIAEADALSQFAGVFGMTDSGPISSAARQARAVLEGTGRCRLEEIEIAGERRYLVQNWRREPRSAPKRILL